MSSAVPIKKYFILFLNRHNAYCSVKCKKKKYKKNYFVHNYIFWIALNFTGCLPLTLTFRVIEFKLSFIKYNNYWDSKFEIEKYKKPWKTEENLKGYGVGVCQNIMREKKNNLIFVFSFSPCIYSGLILIDCFSIQWGRPHMNHINTIIHTN